MQESKNKSLADLQNKQKIVVLVFLILVIGLFINIIYRAGYNSGKKNADEKSRLSSLNNNVNSLPASGKVAKISQTQITIKLLGKQTVTANIDSQTEITVAKKKATVKDIKKDARAVIFTRNLNGKSLATRISVD